MITRSKQNWQVGSLVKVGFLQLRVTACVPTPGDAAPDAYFLTNLTGDKLYEFVPHHGLRVASLDDAAERVTAYRRHVELVAAQAISRAAKADAISSRFNQLFAEVA
jgi:hypothetical protein